MAHHDAAIPTAYSASEEAKEEMGPLVVDDEPEQEPVTKRELWGFYGYGWASEPFNVMMAGVFYPIVLESLASAAGYELDGVTPCNTNKTDYSCLTKFGNSLIDTTSYTLYVTTIAVLIQFIVFVSVGGSHITDLNWVQHTSHESISINVRSRLTVLTCSSQSHEPATRSTQTLPSHFFLSWRLVYTVTYGASVVFWYAYLPTLVRHHPTVIGARADNNLSPKEFAAVGEAVSNTISGHGFAVGYAGGIVALIIGAGILIALGQDTMQIAIAFGGLWWGLFTLVVVFWTKPRPGPPLPAGENYWTYSWKRVAHTVGQARHLSETFKFLIAWFLLSDGVNTIFYIALFFAKKEVGMKNTEACCYLKNHTISHHRGPHHSGHRHHRRIPLQRPPAFLPSIDQDDDLDRGHWLLPPANLGPDRLPDRVLRVKIQGGDLRGLGAGRPSTGGYAILLSRPILRAPPRRPRERVLRTLRNHRQGLLLARTPCRRWHQLRRPHPPSWFLVGPGHPRSTCRAHRVRKRGEGEEGGASVQRGGEKGESSKGGRAGLREAGLYT
ncbi:hypothetical protein BC938DRAFT_480479 [Jimgerdemannia flammicorona]|uniref:Autophagy-related protein n=1 Tax=Jimgerdemannia flammicorona TaxID=994334 RepID=A0A433QIG0_9FUNG|nr:hypothetical protein BC938DRAFT_480479 [Jimgerdemannia flammicorona]